MKKLLFLIFLSSCIDKSKPELYLYDVEIEYCTGKKDTIQYQNEVKSDPYISNYKVAVPEFNSGFYATGKPIMNVCNFEILKITKIL